MVKKHKYLRLLLITGISVFTFIYFLSCLTPWISPLYFKNFTYLALLSPWFLLGMLVVLLLSSFFFRRYSLFFLLVILFGYKNIFSTIGFNYPKHFKQEKAATTFRLLSWNVDDFLNSEKRFDSSNSPRRNILKFIKSVNADVMCFQDFKSYEENRLLASNIIYLVDTLKYPYYYFSVDDPYENEFYPRKYGTAIFSKYPIVDSGRFAYNWKHFPEHLMYANLNINHHTIRVYNTHLRSMMLHKFGKDSTEDYSFVQDDTTIIFYGHRYQKLLYYDSVHLQQAQIIKEQLNNCTLPFIFCADLNSVPSSYVYQHISKGLNDAFIQNGSGWSGTYSALSPTLRIDVVLMCRELNSTQYYSPRIQNASDHYPIVTDIAIH